MWGDLCGLFAIVLMGIALLTAVGHGLWLFFAALLRAMGGQPPTPPVPSRRTQPASQTQHRVIECLRCGERLSAGVNDCPRCGLDLEGLVAGELADLEALARQLQRFARDKQVPAQLLDEMWKLVQVRHQRLLGAPEKEAATPVSPLPVPLPTPSPEPLPVPGASANVPPLAHTTPAGWVETRSIEPVRNGLDIAPSEEIPSVLPFPRPAAEDSGPGQPPPWRRLQLLLENRSEDELTSSERVRLVLWYRQSPGERLEMLPAATQLKLARLLHAARLETEALRCYQRCLDRYPQQPDYVPSALEALRIAVGIHSPEARELVDALRRRDLTAQEREALGGLADELEPASAVSPGYQTETSELVADELEILPDSDTEVAAAVPRERATSGTSSLLLGTQHAEEPSDHLPLSASTAIAKPPRSGTWAQVLAGFMEEKNILWGELVGGLLIVGGSIALVVSLWHQLKENPYFPFGIFTGVTLALFGAALYAWSHWKLQTTSRGLLAIATLLVPLSFLVMPSMLGEPANDRLELAAGGVALAVFGWCLLRAAGVLVPQGRWLLPLAVLASCAGQLVGVRVIDVDQPTVTTLLSLGLVPLSGFMVSVGWFNVDLRRRQGLDFRALGSLFGLLGLSAFALAVGLGFFVVRCPDALLALKELAPLLGIAGVPILSSGLLVHERLAGDPTRSSLRTTGTTLLLAGMAVMLLAVALAWPLPWALVAASAVGVAALAWVGLRHDLPLAHLPAAACLAAGYLALFHLDQMYTPSLSEQLLYQAGTMTSALRLVFLGTGFVALSELLARWRRPHGRPYAWAAGGVGTVAVIVASRHGAAFPAETALVYGVAGAACLAVNARWARMWLSYIGLSLVLGATLWGLHATVPRDFAAWSAVLAGEALLLASFGTLLVRVCAHAELHPGEESRPRVLLVFGNPCLHLAEGIAGIALGFGLWAGWWEAWRVEQVLAGLLLAATYLVLTAVQRRLVTAALAGWVLIATVVAATESHAVNLDLPVPRTLLATVIAMTSCVMALVTMVISIWLQMHAGPAGDQQRRRPWYGLLPLAWREAILSAGVLALFLYARAMSLPEEPRPTIMLASLAVTAWLMAWQHRATILAWVGSVLALLFLGHVLDQTVTRDTLRLAIVTLLVHAAIHLLAALCLHARLGTTAKTGSVRRVFVRPLLGSGLITSFLSLPLLLVNQGDFLTRSLYSCWLAALWLAVAWTLRWRWLLAGFQLVCMIAVVLGVSSWLEVQPWATVSSAWPWDPRSLQAYGVGLALLCGVWALARIALQGNRTGQQMLLPDWPSLDHVLLSTLALAQLGLIDWAVLREVVIELGPRGMTPALDIWPEIAPQALGMGAWLLLGVLAAVLVVSLWQPAPGSRQRLAITGLAILSLSLPPLLAAPFASDRAVEPALRWGLALVLLAASAPVWLRRPLGTVAARLRAPQMGSTTLVRQVRLILLEGLLVPAALLTFAAAGLQFCGYALSGPAANSLFANLGQPLSLALPVIVIAVALTGHALRESSPGYAFSAGLMLALAVTGAYALVLLPGHPVFGDAEWVQLLQVCALCLALWAVICLTTWPWTRCWRDSGSSLAGPLMAVQVAVPALLNVLLLLVGVSFLIVLPEPMLLVPGEVWYPAASAWTISAGAPLGWLALTATATVAYLWPGRRVTAPLLGSLLLGVIALAACAVAGSAAEWSFRTVLFGLAAFVVGWAAVPWWHARFERRPDADAPARWVTAVGLVLFLLCLEAALVHQDRLVAACVLATDALAITMIGFALRDDRRVFAGGQILTIATILAVWHFNLDEPLSAWWIHLLQFSGISLAAFSLLWLQQGRATEAMPTKRSSVGLLICLLALATLTLAVPLAALTLLVLGDPEATLTTWATQAAAWPGWLQLLVTLAALHRFAGDAASRRSKHFVGVAGLLLVMQLVATAHYLSPGDWLAYHTLITGLALLGMFMLVGGWIGTSLGDLGPRAWSTERRERLARRLLDYFPALWTQQWVEALGIALTGLAIRAGIQDPSRPWWPAAAILWSCLLATGLLFWTRRAGYLHIIGALVALLGPLFWLAWGHESPDLLLLMSVLALAAGSLATDFLQRQVQRLGIEMLAAKRLTWADRVADVSLRLYMILVLVLLFRACAGAWSHASAESHEAFATFGGLALLLGVIGIMGWLVSESLSRNNAADVHADKPASFSEKACLLGLNLLSILVLIGLASDLSKQGLHLAGPLAWTAWAVLAVAAVRRSFTSVAEAEALAGVPAYAAGLLGVLLLLHHGAFGPTALAQLAAPLLGAFVLCASVSACAVSHLVMRRGGKRAIEGAGFVPARWFLVVQGMLTALIVGLAFWICCTRATVADRLIGPASLLMLVPAWALLVPPGGPQVKPSLVRGLRQTALALGILLLLAVAWAWLEPGVADIELLRNIAVLGVLGAVCLLYGPLARRALPGSGWQSDARDLARACWFAGAIGVVLVLVHELWLYRVASHPEPLDDWAIIVLLLALVALIASSIWFAVSPRHDPFVLSEAWRRKYVYAAEALLVLLFLHVRLNLPWLFTGSLIHYWSFLIMGIAFLGVGLAEWFARLRLPVLAVPLRRTGVFLPLLPLLAFWLSPLAPGLPATATKPGSPLADLVRNLPHDFAAYALVWYTASLLYLVVALVNRSGKYMLIAALAGNFGLWAMLYHHQGVGLGFVQHPQLWLIPLAVIVLVAEHVNRDRLTPQASQGLRYFGLVVIYLSSTSDLFIAGLQDLGMSLVLLVLSVLGVLAGIQFRIRAFLFTGLVFLVLVIFARIWHAAVDQQQTWVWWASLIVLGAAILTLFAFFEKRRADLLRLLDEFKNWK